MPDSEVTAELVDSARRWASSLRELPPGSAEHEDMVRRLAVEMQDQRERARQGADERFATFYRSCPAGVVLVDETGVITAVNPAFDRLAGHGHAHIGAEIASLGASEADAAMLRDVAAELTQPDTGRVREYVSVNAAGGVSRLVRLTAAALPGGDTRYPILMFEDIHDHKQLQETFQHQGLHDALTGLPNNGYLRSRLETTLAGGHANQVALLYLDIDGFKVINSGLGGDAADRVLYGVAATLRRIFAEYDAFVARLFGDAFAVALYGSLTPASTIQLVEHAIEQLAKPVYVGEVGVGVSVSVGIVVTDVLGAEHIELMRSAEVALHRAKALGKAQWVLFDPDSDTVDRERYWLASSISGALETGEIALAYQPHAVLPDAGIVTSMNAALRWEHPTRGRLTPDEFYPLAEITGMTVPLGRRLLAEALRTTADWRERYGTDAPMVCLTLPRRMAIDADLVGIVRGELDANGLAAEHLMLCVDGPSLLDDRGDLIESIGHLAKLGVTFILNITGLPDLELVQAMAVPAPGAMLTGPVVAALDADEPPDWAQRTVRQLVERAEELDVKLGAYGVRSQRHAALLFDLGVVVGAGPYLPEYVTSAEAEKWVGRNFPMD